MSEHKIFSMAFSKVYPMYVQKAEKKDRTNQEVDQIIKWLTGYTKSKLKSLIAKDKTIKEFITEAPKLNPDRLKIKGVVCGVRVEDVEDPLMRELRYLDKLIDELAKGKSMDKILRKD